MQSETIQELVKALLKAQTDFGHVSKDKTAKAGSFSYQYADLKSVLEAVQAPLAENGLLLTQTTRINEGPALVSYLFHTSGEWIASEWPLPAEATPQQMGSALTYGRRYTAMALFGIAPEEDDDGAAAEKAKRTARKSPQKAQPAAAPPAPKKQITLMRAQDASEMHFDATKAGAAAAFQALDILLEENATDNWVANRSVVMRLLATAPDHSIGTMTVKEKVDELVTLYEGIVP